MASSSIPSQIRSSGQLTTLRCEIRPISFALRERSCQPSPADKVVEEAALDKYAYIRDAYLQRRRSQILMAIHALPEE